MDGTGSQANKTNSFAPHPVLQKRPVQQLQFDSCFDVQALGAVVSVAD